MFSFLCIIQYNVKCPRLSSDASAVAIISQVKRQILISSFIQYRFWFNGEMTIGLMVYRGFYFRAFDSSGILQSGFWFIGKFVIGVLVYRGFGYRAFDLSGFCYRANGHRAFSYRPYVVLPSIHDIRDEVQRFIKVFK